MDIFMEKIKVKNVDLVYLLSESEKSHYQYQRLYNLAIHLCGPLNLLQLMEEVTNVLRSTFSNVKNAYMYVFDDQVHTYPGHNKARQISKLIFEKYAPKAQDLKEINRFDKFIVAPIRETTEGDSPLGILVLESGENQFDFQKTKKKLLTLSTVVEKATRRVLIEEERKRVAERAKGAEAFGGLIGEGAPMQEVKELILQVSRTDITVLIQGETGTGKELVAKAILENSERKGKPFVDLNCGALPETLIEAELFGIEDQVATDVKGRPGLFEQADGGTIFLDEIGEMPSAQQVKLLRVLQEGEIRRLGDTKTRTVDVRVIAATNKDLWHQVNMGTFRSDLYYRLNVFPIKLSPLRERGKKGILHLAQHFLHKYAVESRYFSEDTKNILLEYTWPGNVRELEHAIVRAIASSTFEITPDHLPIVVTQPQNTLQTSIESPQLSDTTIEQILRQLVREEIGRLGVRSTTTEVLLEKLCANEEFAKAVELCNLKSAKKQLETFLMEAALDKEGSQSKAAETLGVSRTKVGIFQGSQRHKSEN